MNPADVELALPSLGLGQVSQFGFPWHGRATDIGGVELPNGEKAPMMYASSFPPFHRLVRLPGAAADPVTPQYIADQGGEFWNCALLSGNYRDPSYTCLFGRQIGGQALYEATDGSVWLYKVEVIREGYAVKDWYEFDSGGYVHDGELVFSVRQFGVMPSAESEWIGVQLPSLRQLFGGATEAVEHVMGSNQRLRLFDMIVCDSTPAGDRLLLGLYSSSFFDGSYEINGGRYNFASGAIFGLFEIGVSGVPGTDSFSVNCDVVKGFSDCTQGSYSETRVPAPAWSLTTDYLPFDGTWSGMCNGNLSARHLMSARYRTGTGDIEALYKSITAISTISGHGTYVKLDSESDYYHCTGFGTVYNYVSHIDICGQSYSLNSSYSEIGSGVWDERSITIICDQTTVTPLRVFSSAGQQVSIRGEDGAWSVTSSGENIPPMALGSLNQSEPATDKLALAMLMTPLIRVGNLYGPWSENWSQRFYDVGVIIHGSGILSSVFVQGGNRGDNYIDLGPTTTPGSASDSVYRATSPDDVKSYSWCPIRDDLIGSKKTEGQMSWV